MVSRLSALLRRFRSASHAEPTEMSRPADPAAEIRPWRVEGSFDSSYSLALVNRRLALALQAAGLPAELYATEGPGDFTPNAAFLAAHPEVDALWQKGQSRRPARAVFRNVYPPRVTEMDGAVRVLGPYGWEESEFPMTYGEAFNAHLELIATMSDYVAKTLTDNGIVTPKAVVGLGLDHLDDVAATPLPVGIGAGGFRFLHVSSCFPRKGLDVLLAAWGEAFSRDDDVCLVIKTFPNPHNDAAEQIAALAQRFPRHAEIVLINQDLSDGAMVTLYETADAVVIPSRGEGFGLPIGEAMWFGRPVIATAHGGQMDFCDADSVWLLDYRFAYAETHLSAVNSVWAEPDCADLTRLLRHLQDPASKAERLRKAALAAERVRRTVRWSDVARRVQAAVEACPPIATTLPAVTWIAPCPQARRLLAAAPPDAAVTILAGDGADPATVTTRHLLVSYPSFGRSDDELAALLDGWLQGGKVVTLLLDRLPVSPSLRAACARCWRLVVSRLDDLNALKAIGLHAPATLLPWGLEARAALPTPQGPALLACLGNFSTGAGWTDLVAACRDQPFRLRLIDDGSGDFLAETALRAKLLANRAVSVMTASAPDALRDVSLLLVRPQDDDDALARSLRDALRLGPPVVCLDRNPSHDLAQAIPGLAFSDVVTLLNDPAALAALNDRQNAFLAAHRWDQQALRLLRLATAPAPLPVA